MRSRSTLLPMVLTLILSAPVLAAPGGNPRDDKPPPTEEPSSLSTGAGERSNRKEAEDLYALAYEEIAKAKKDLENKKDKNAAKKFKRALERSEQCVELDSTYYQAWNLVGYSARKLGSYDKAFPAYEKCLALKPDYAPAREYLGEAWLEKGDVTKAREQLDLLVAANAAEAANLKTQIEAYEAAHPEAKAAAPASATPAAAAADTSGSH